MKFSYEDNELSVFEDDEEMEGMDALSIWDNEEGVIFQIGDGYELKQEDDGYGGTILIAIRRTAIKRKEE